MHALVRTVVLDGSLESVSVPVIGTVFEAKQKMVELFLEAHRYYVRDQKHKIMSADFGDMYAEINVEFEGAVYSFRYDIEKGDDN